MPPEKLSYESNEVHIRIKFDTGRPNHQTIDRLPPRIRYPFSVRTQGM